MPDKELLSGFWETKKITRQFARSFYLASLFLPKDKKYASYAVYAICRLSDETVDGISNSGQEDRLREMERKISAAYAGDKTGEPLLAAFQRVVNSYKIPKEYFDALVEGMRMDLEIKRYRNFPSLYEYCYRVAGVVGLIMLKIFGYNDRAAQDYAVKLGIAMQLTNILRDINEDFSRGRIYLPLDEMAGFGVSERQIAEGRNDERLKNLLRFQIARNREFYNQSLAGIKLINNPLCRFAALNMKEIYSGILDSIEKNNYDVFTRRAHVSKLKKTGIILKVLLAGKYL